jgi:hypothetical protein
MWIALLLLPVAGGCGGVKNVEWVDEQRTREADAKPLVGIAAPDGSFKGRVAAELHDSIGGKEEQFYARFDIGAAAPMECTFFPEELDLATSLQANSAETFDLLVEHFGTVEGRRISAVDAGSFGASPFLAIDWMYVTTIEEEEAAGEIKHVVASVDGRSIYCIHNELGYKETFRRAFRSLVENIEYDAVTELPPQYSEILVYSVQDRRVGIEQVTLAYDDEGDARTVVYDALLFAASESELIAQDSTDVQFTTANGAMMNQIHALYRNGEAESSLTLLPGADPGVWHVEGSFKSKPIDALFYEENLSSWLGNAVILQEALEGRGAEAIVEVVQWIPHVHPIEPIALSVRVQEAFASGDFSAQMSVGPVQMDVVIDGSGSTKSGVVRLGAADLQVERIFAEGKPKP